MCLGIPGKVISIDESSILRMGRVSFAGLERDVSLSFVPDANVNDYVIVHVGHAISRLDPAAAEKTLKLLDEIEKQSQQFEGDK